MAGIYITDLELGQVVYLKTDEDQTIRIVTAITINAGGGIQYKLNCSTEESWHYMCEITLTRLMEPPKGNVCQTSPSSPL